MMPPTPRSTLFPYTTLFRSCRVRRSATETAAPRLWGHEARARSQARAAVPRHPMQPARNRADHSLSRPRLRARSEEHTSELQSHSDLVCRLLLEKKKKTEKK